MIPRVNLDPHDTAAFLGGRCALMMGCCKSMGHSERPSSKARFSHHCVNTSPLNLSGPLDFLEGQGLVGRLRTQFSRIFPSVIPFVNPVIKLPCPQP